jgi:hypothetical protein
MKVLLSISTILVAFGVRAFGQAVPTATATNAPTPAGTASPRISWLDGTVHYALSATELVQFGYYGNGNVASTTALSGNAGYANLSQTHPFSLLFAGGVLFGQGGQGVTTYQNVAASQGYIHGKWSMEVADSFSFLPQSPTTGIAGIAGVGNLGTSVPIQGPSSGPAGGVLTYSANRIANSLSGNIERRLTGRTSISAGSSWTVLHFLDQNAGLDTRSISGTVALNHRINVRNSVSVAAVYSTYDTSGLYANLPGYAYNNVTYSTKGINLTYMRQWTRALSMDVTAGPQWISSSAADIVPNRLNIFVNAGLSYTRQLTNYGVRYSHGVNSGSGSFAGAEADTVSANVSHNFSQEWAASAWVNYTHTRGLLVTVPNAGLAANGAVDTTYGTIQLMRRFTRTISGYASYSAQNQSVNSALASPNTFQGLSHTIAFGVTWAPQSTRLGDF